MTTYHVAVIHIVISRQTIKWSSSIIIKGKTTHEQLNKLLHYISYRTSQNTGRVEILDESNIQTYHLEKEVLESYTIANFTNLSW